MGFGFWVLGLGFGVWGLEFGFEGLGLGDWVLGFGGWSLGFGVWGLGFGVWGVGFGVWGLGAEGRGLGLTMKGLRTWRRCPRPTRSLLTANTRCFTTHVYYGTCLYPMHVFTTWHTNFYHGNLPRNFSSLLRNFTTCDGGRGVGSGVGWRIMRWFHLGRLADEEHIVQSDTIIPLCGPNQVSVGGSGVCWRISRRFE